MEQVEYTKKLTLPTGLPYFTIEARTEESFLRVVWRGYINVERAKEGMLTELEAMKKTGRLNMLIDNRKQTGPFPKEINAWIAEVFFPELQKIGFVKTAQILSENIFTEYSAKKMENSNVNKTDIALIANFGNEEEALKWLLG